MPPALLNACVHLASTASGAPCAVDSTTVKTLEDLISQLPSCAIQAQVAALCCAIRFLVRKFKPAKSPKHLALVEGQSCATHVADRRSSLVKRTKVLPPPESARIILQLQLKSRAVNAAACSHKLSGKT